MRIGRRDDVDPQEGIRNYGRVEFADPVNNRYPIDTPEHVRAAWARVHIARNAMFYSAAELEEIKRRIVTAAKKLEVELSQEVVERDARLFTAGDYPDRGMEVTEADLDRMVEWHVPVPIRVEHTESPLDLGLVTRIWRQGKDLFGRLAFTAPAWALIEQCGAKRLSAGIKRDKSGLTEVSLVRRPRVEGAAVFGGLATFEFSIEGTEMAENAMPEGGSNMSESKAADFSKRIEDLENELRERDVDARIDALKRAGKLVPASEGLARAILSAGAHAVTFSEGVEKPLSEVFAEFLEAQPKVVEFSELAEGAKELAGVSDEERRLYDRLGVSPETVARVKSRHGRREVAQ